MIILNNLRLKMQKDLCVYILMDDYLCLYMLMSYYLCVYIVMGDYLCVYILIYLFTKYKKDVYM